MNRVRMVSKLRAREVAQVGPRPTSEKATRSADLRQVNTNAPSIFWKGKLFQVRMVLQRRMGADTHLTGAVTPFTDFHTAYFRLTFSLGTVSILPCS